MADRLLTPSKITAWLDCAHFLTLQHEVDGHDVEVESPLIAALDDRDKLFFDVTEIDARHKAAAPTPRRAGSGVETGVGDESR